MSDLLRGVPLDELLDVVRNPTSNLTAATVLLAMVVLVLIILLTGVGLYLVRSGGRAERKPGEAAPRRARRKLSRGERTAFTVMWVAVLLLALAGAVGGLTTRDTCLRCHADVVEAGRVASAPHNTIACASCHAEPGPVGRITLAAQTLQDVSVRAFGTGDVSPRRPASAGCRRCHDDLSKTVTADRVRVAHADFIDGHGFRCIDCHGSVGHGPADRPNDRPSMQLCLRCHGVDPKASAKCPTCHVGDITGAREVSILDYPRVQLGPVRTCRGCHSVERCNRCHGLELPHPADFKMGEVHGPLAAFERKELCGRCHSRGECATECHPGNKFPSDGHYPAWRQDHGRDSSAERQAWCRSCHTKANFRCAMCHR